MRLEYPESVNIICFADDAALVATGQTTCLLERAMNDSLERVAAWIAKHGLTLSSSMTTAVMLSTYRGYVKPTFRINGAEIALSDSVRYVSVRLSQRLGDEYSVGADTADAKCRKPVCGKKEVAIHSGIVSAVVCFTHMVQCASPREV